MLRDLFRIRLRGPRAVSEVQDTSPCRSVLPVDTQRSARRCGARRHDHDAMMMDVIDDETNSVRGQLSARHARSRMRLLPAMIPPPS